jgi:type II secretory pathway pseudopilin PulG
MSSATTRSDRPRMRRRPGARPGFSFIELVVVLLTIMLLVGLLLPAVNSVREAARRAHCLNNLRQLALAVSGYESFHKTFPPGTVNPTGPVANLPNGYHHNWATALLPFLEQAPLFHSVNYQVSVYDPAHVTARGTVISTLVCPTNPLGPRAGGFAQSSYAGCHDDGETPIDATNNGLFYLNGAVRREEILPPSFLVVLFGEKPIEPDLGWMSGTRATLRNTDRRLTTTPPGPLVVGSFQGLHPATNFAHADGSARAGTGGLGNRLDKDAY